MHTCILQVCKILKLFIEVEGILYSEHPLWHFEGSENAAVLYIYMCISYESA